MVCHIVYRKWAWFLMICDMLSANLCVYKQKLYFTPKISIQQGQTEHVNDIIESSTVIQLIDIITQFHTINKSINREHENKKSLYIHKNVNKMITIYRMYFENCHFLDKFQQIDDFCFFWIGIFKLFLNQLFYKSHWQSFVSK